MVIVTRRADRPEPGRQSWRPGGAHWLRDSEQSSDLIQFASESLVAARASLARLSESLYVTWTATSQQAFRVTCSAGGPGR